MILTLNARGFSCAVSGFGYVFRVFGLRLKTFLLAVDEAPRRTREKPLVPMVRDTR